MLLPIRQHTCTHTHTYVHTHVHNTHTHTCMHMHTHTHTATVFLEYLQGCSTAIEIHDMIITLFEEEASKAREFAHRFIEKRQKMISVSQVRACAHTHTHTHARTHTHTCAHTHTHYPADEMSCGNVSTGQVEVAGVSA